MVNNWITIIQDSLLPPTCILCNSPGFKRWDICSECYIHLPWAHHQCPRCGFRLTESTPIEQLCGECQSSPPAFDFTVAAFNYQSTLRYLITHLKFNQQYKHARLLGLLMADVLAKQPDRPEAVIPMPLHTKRFQARGFNQSIEIARTIAKQLAIPVLDNQCIRTRDTPHQTELTRAARHKNVKQSFSISKPVYAKHVAIIDDVMTTGATVHELAKVLKHHGVVRVDAWVCARA